MREAYHSRIGMEHSFWVLKSICSTLREFHASFYRQIIIIEKKQEQSQSNLEKENSLRTIVHDKKQFLRVFLSFQGFFRQKKNLEEEQ